MLAHYLGQGKLYEGFLAGIDPHQMTAAMVLGKDPADVTKAERQAYGKSINFAVVYGAGDNKVASMIGNGTTPREARKFLDRHETEFPEIYGFKEYILDQCRAARPPHITTLWGRKRRVPGILSSDKGMRLYSERQAFNSLIQGSSADILKFAKVRLAERMPEWMNLHLAVHDELVCSAPVEKVDDARSILLDAMVGPGIGDMLRVPLRSDVAVVQRWAKLSSTRGGHVTPEMPEDPMLGIDMSDVEPSAEPVDLTPVLTRQLTWDCLPCGEVEGVLLKLGMTPGHPTAWPSSTTTAITASSRCCRWSLSSSSSPACWDRHLDGDDRAPGHHRRHGRRHGDVRRADRRGRARVDPGHPGQALRGGHRHVHARGPEEDHDVSTFWERQLGQQQPPPHVRARLSPRAARGGRRRRRLIFSLLPHRRDTSSRAVALATATSSSRACASRTWTSR